MTQHQFKPHLGLKILYKLFSSLLDLEAGNYLLHHESKYGSFASLMKTTSEGQENTTTHHQIIVNVVLVVRTHSICTKSWRKRRYRVLCLNGVPSTWVSCSPNTRSSNKCLVCFVDMRGRTLFWEEKVNFYCWVWDVFWLIFWTRIQWWLIMLLLLQPFCFSILFYFIIIKSPRFMQVKLQTTKKRPKYFHKIKTHCETLLYVFGSIINMHSERIIYFRYVFVWMQICKSFRRVTIFRNLFLRLFVAGAKGNKKKKKKKTKAAL